MTKDEWIAEQIAAMLAHDLIGPSGSDRNAMVAYLHNAMAFADAHPQQQAEGLLDEIRNLGWMVAVHNDYMQNGERFTFWLFTKDNQCAKGEGRTDAEAIKQTIALLDARRKGQG